MIRVTVLAAALVVSAAGAVAADAAPDPKYSWNLRELYPTEAAWSKALSAAVADIPKIADCRGKLVTSAPTLLACLNTYYDIDLRLTRVGVYAGMNFDLDTRGTK